MATSSITHNFVIKGDTVERFANALEASFNTEVPDTPPAGSFIASPQESRELLKKWLERYGNNGKN